MPLAEMMASLSTNPYFSAGAGLFGVGMAAAILKRGTQVRYRTGMLVLRIGGSSWSLFNHFHKRVGSHTST